MKSGFWNSTFIFVGPAYCGMSTLSTLLLNESILKNMDSTSVRIFRRDNEVAKYCERLLEVPKMAKCIQQFGGQVPSFIVDTLLGNFATEILKEDCSIFDGYPRSSSEAILLDKILSFAGKTREKILVFNLVIDSKEIIKRIDDSNRSTMKPRVLATNALWFGGEESDVLDFYKEHDYYEIVDLDASRPQADVFADIMKATQKHFDIK